MSESFFEAPPPAPEPEEPVLPAWCKPEGVIGAVAPMSFVLARTADVAVAVWGVTAFDAGFELVVASLTRRRHMDLHRGNQFELLRRASADGVLPDELLRIGITFADGTKVTNVAGDPFAGGVDAPPARVLMPGGGSGSTRRSTQTYWCWPLPPAGPLTFVCEWPEHGIPLTEHTVDAAPILEASTRALRLWD